jgi:beta-glucosidase
VVSERALREIYFPAFKAAVQEAGCLGFMNSYNLVNGEYTGESRWLLDEVLRKEWGFKGLVMSDWNSLWNSDRAAQSGVDLEMPGGQQCFVLAPEKLKELLKKGTITQANIDEKVFNIVRTCLLLNLYDKNFLQPALNRLKEHQKVALETAREGIVLLKNEGNFLPLEEYAQKKIIVTGPTGIKTPTTGGGSGAVSAVDPIDLFTAIKAIYPNAEFMREFDAEKVKNADAVIVGVGNNFGLKIQAYASIEEEQDAFNKGAEEVEGEGRDRRTLELLPDQQELIKKCAELNPNTTVMIVAGGGVKMTPWIDQVKAVMWLFYPGENGSQAAAEIFAGIVNPSGKLPVSIERELKDNPAFENLGLSWSPKATPKKAGIRDYWDVNYDEDIFVGYRYYLTQKVQPLFCFGYGLSYTQFKYDNLFVRKDKNGIAYVSLDVTNTGKRSGKEVVQLYIEDVQSSVPRPLRELKGFQKIFLAPGETKTVTFRLDSSAFAFWSPEKKEWTVEPGEFKICLGDSSEEIKLQKSIEL